MYVQPTSFLKKLENDTRWLCVLWTSAGYQHRHVVSVKQDLPREFRVKFKEKREKIKLVGIETSKYACFFGDRVPAQNTALLQNARYESTS